MRPTSKPSEGEVRRYLVSPAASAKLAVFSVSVDAEAVWLPAGMEVDGE